MNFLKIWWHCRWNKGHTLDNYHDALGFATYYCGTCRYGLND